MKGAGGGTAKGERGGGGEGVRSAGAVWVTRVPSWIT